MDLNLILFQMLQTNFNITCILFQPAPNLPPPVQIPPPMAVDLQDWLEQEPMIEPAMIDDLELAIALSLQEQVDIHIE